MSIFVLFLFIFLFVCFSLFVHNNLERWFVTTTRYLMSISTSTGFSVCAPGIIRLLARSVVTTLV